MSSYTSSHYIGNVPRVDSPKVKTGGLTVRCASSRRPVADK